LLETPLVVSLSAKHAAAPDRRSDAAEVDGQALVFTRREARLVSGGTLAAKYALAGPGPLIILMS